MKTILLYTSLILFACCGFVPSARAAEPADAVPLVSETPAFEEIIITVRDNQIRIQNAEGFQLDIYNVAGVKVTSLRIDGADKTIAPNLTRGIYIVKVGKVARRINIF